MTGVRGPGAEALGDGNGIVKNDRVRISIGFYL